MKVSTSGAYAGIGVEVVPGKDGVSVVRRMANSPAERAGIQTGDVIVSIDGIAVDPADLDAAIARMRGPEGSAIRLAVRRAGSGALLEFPGRARAGAAAQRRRRNADAASTGTCASPASPTPRRPSSSTQSTGSSSTRTTG